MTSASFPLHGHVRIGTLPFARRETAAAHTRDRAVWRLKKQCEALIANERAFSERELRTGRAFYLHRAVQRTVDTMQVMDRTVRRVAEKVHVNNLSRGEEAPTRTSRQRIHPKELARVRTPTWDAPRAAIWVFMDIVPFSLPIAMCQ